MLKKEIFLNSFPNKYERILKKKFKNIKFSKRVNNTTNAIISFNRQCFDEFFESFDFDKMVNLKWIHIPFSGIEKYQKFKLIKNINFTSSRNIQSSQVAEHSIAILLSITRKIDFLSKNGIDKKFDSFPTEIKGKKVLIFGYGAVGKEIKNKITSFKPKISIFTNKTIKKPSSVYKIYSLKNIYKAIKENQIIFFCIPLKEENISIISLKALNCIKKGSVVVSVSREEIFDLVALKKIIKKKYIRFGIDFYSKDFLLKNKYLTKQKNVLLTPHIAGLSDQYSDLHFKNIIFNIKNFQNNKKLKHLIFYDE